MKNLKVFALGFSLSLLVGINISPMAQADESHCNIDWQRLQLSSQQNQQIQMLEGQWNQAYLDIQPAIVEDQRRLTRLLSDPKSDALEIMTLQQGIARRKEQLRSVATANYLRKRQVLNDDQQRSLEDMIRQVLATRQRTLNPGSQTDVMSDRIQGLFERVRNVWPR